MGLWEQLGLAAFMQRHWADNQVSCTVTFDPHSEGAQLPHALDLFQYQLKGVSFLPRHKLKAPTTGTTSSAVDTPYPQMPYESITQDRYHFLASALDPTLLAKELQKSTLRGQLGSAQGGGAENVVPDNFCDSDGCSVEQPE